MIITYPEITLSMEEYEVLDRAYCIINRICEIDHPAFEPVVEVAREAEHALDKFLCSITEEDEDEEDDDEEFYEEALYEED